MVREVKRKVPSVAAKGLLARAGKALDDVIFSLAPVWGAKRRAARQYSELSAKRVAALSASWDSETDVRVRGDRWLASGLSPDTVLDANIRELQNRSAELYRKNGIAHAAIEGRVGNEVGVGITARPRVRAFDKPRNKEINDALKDVIARWSKAGTDKGRRLSLGGLQRQVCRTYATYGEVFCLFGAAAYRGSIPLCVEVIAPERVETPPEKANDPHCRMGVQYNAKDEVIGYHVRTQHPGDGLQTEYEHKYYPRFDSNGQPRMVHVFEPLFAGQSRGFPWLCAAMNRILDVDNFFESELINKQVEACFGIIFKGGPNSESPHDRAERAKAGTDARGNRLEDWAPGTVHYANEDEEPMVVDPSRPGATFEPFIQLSLRSIAATLNFPYEILAANFFRTTFSSGRLSMLNGRLGFKMRSQVLVEMFLTPLYDRIVYEAVFVDELGGLIDLLDYREQPWIYEQCKWVGQGWAFIDPEKEVKAHVLGIDEDIETKADVFAENGEDWEEQDEQRHLEKMRAIENEVEQRKHRMKLETAAGLMVTDAPEEEETGNPKVPKPQTDKNKMSAARKEYLWRETSPETVA